MDVQGFYNIENNKVDINIFEKQQSCLDVIATIFIEIANFFKRLFCCCGSAEFYEQKKDSVILIPKSNPSIAPEKVELAHESNREELTSEEKGEEPYFPPIPDVRKPVRQPLISNEVVQGLKTYQIEYKELESYLSKIDNKQDAIDFIEVCLQLPTLSITEDYLRKLALIPGIIGLAIQAAFEEKGLSRKKYLPKDHFTKHVGAFPPTFFDGLQVRMLANLCQAHSTAKTSVANYKDKNFDIRLTRLIELGDEVGSAEANLNADRDRLYGKHAFMCLKEKIEDSKTRQHFYLELNSLLVDLQSKNLQDMQKVKEDLLEYLLSDKHPSIRSTCKDLQKNILQLFFTYASNEQLSRFISKDVNIKKNDIGHGFHADIKSDFTNSFFEELTEERQKALLPLLDLENSVIDWDFIYSLGHTLNDSDHAAKLICNFYEKKPNSEIWEKINEEKCDPWRRLRSDLAGRKILLLLTQYIALDNKTEESFKKLSDDIYACFKTFPNDSRADYYVNKHVKKIMVEILKLNDSIGGEITEKLFAAFVLAFSRDSEYCSIPFEMSYAITKTKFNELWLSKFESLSVKILLQSYLDQNEIWDRHLINNIYTEGQMNAFIDICLQLPPYLQKIQFHTFRKESRHIDTELKSKIIEERKIDVTVTEEKNWSAWRVYRNGFKLKPFLEEISSLNSQPDVERWIANNKKKEIYLQILAGGIQFEDGSIVKCPLEANVVKDAFKANKLYYEGFTDPIDLYDFLSNEDVYM